MSNPTSNYSFVMPTPTDLVTDLPADFEVFGQAVDTQMKTNADAATQKATLTTKGDLYAASAASTPARLAVGTNGQVLTADSTAATGVSWATPSAGSTNMAGKNAVLNSNFSVWQRGTSIVPTTTSYSADRWQAYRGVSGSTVSRQLTNDTTNLPFIQYCARNQRDSGNTATNVSYLSQSFENINSTPFVGKTVTLSFYARAGANYSTSGSGLLVRLATGTGTDENVIVPGFTGVSNAIAETATLTTTWQRFSYTGTIATSAKQLAVYFQNTWSGTAGADDFYDVTGVQLEIAASATAYSPNAATFQGELSACQRYYYRWTTGGTSTAWAGTGMNYSSTNALVMVKLPVSMRVNPTSIDVTSTASNYRVLAPAGTGGVACSAVPTLDTSHNENPLLSFTTAGSLVAGQGNAAGANSTNSAYIGFNAEL